MSLEDVAVTIVSEREYFSGPSDFSVFIGCVPRIGIDIMGGWQGALVTNVINSLTIGKSELPFDFTVTAFDTVAVMLKTPNCLFDEKWKNNEYIR